MTPAGEGVLLGRVAAYYSDKVRVHGAAPRGVDWNGTESQTERFRQLLDLIGGGACSLNDLGCGYGEFSNALRAGKKYAMDLNPDAARHLGANVDFLLQDCSTRWPLADGSLDVVFTSNFFEHLLNKEMLRATIAEIHRCLKPGGRIIAMGPNIRVLPGAYWDFWDHHVALTDRSLCELFTLEGFKIARCHPRFLPYTMAHGSCPPLFFLKA